MSKANYVRRKWMKLIYNGEHYNIVDFLSSLNVISDVQYEEFVGSVETIYRHWCLGELKKEKKIESRHFNKRPPKVIKPTGNRRF